MRRDSNYTNTLNQKVQLHYAGLTVFQEVGETGKVVGVTEAPHADAQSCGCLENKSKKNEKKDFCLWNIKTNMKVLDQPRQRPTAWWRQRVAGLTQRGLKPVLIVTRS